MKKNKIINGLLCLALVANLFALAPTVSALGEPIVVPKTSDSIQNGIDIISGGKNDLTIEKIIVTVVNTMMFLIGALSVIMIIYGAFRYVTSAGDAKQVESAKNTILYAVIGIIVALLAVAIVNFVTKKIG